MTPERKPDPESAVTMADEMVLLLIGGHTLRPATFWWEGDMIDGLQCGLCHRLFPTGEDAGDYPCDVKGGEGDG